MFHVLLSESLDAFSQVRLAVEIGFAHLSCPRHCVEVDGMLFAEEGRNGIFHSPAFVLTASLCMSRDASCVALPGLLTHGSSPGCVVDAASILRRCIRVHTSHFSPRSGLA